MAAAGNDRRLERGIEVLLNGTLVGERRRVDFVEGADIALSIADDGNTETLTITVESTAVAGGGAWTLQSKAVDEARQSNTTITADDELVLTLDANTRYHIRGCVMFNTPAAADIKFDFNGPAFNDLSCSRWGIAGAGTAFAGVAVDKAWAQVQSLTGTGSDGRYWFDILVDVAGASGDFQVRWAQDSSVASNTTVQRGSFLEWRTC